MGSRPEGEGVLWKPYDELPSMDGLGMRHAWDVFPMNLGSAALSDRLLVLAAIETVKHGRVINLTLPLDEPDPPVFGREPLQHHYISFSRNITDDRLDSFYTHGSTHWDGLRHVRAAQQGYFGGVVDDFDAPNGELGIEHWAETAIIGRGVLLDVRQHRLDRGEPFDVFSGEAIGDHELRRVAEASGVQLRRGDILCIRTGWTDDYRRAGPDARQAVAAEGTSAGLGGSEQMARYLWNSQIMAIAADNPAVEAVPGDASVGSLHRRLIPMLGFLLGELFDFEELADECRRQQRWHFLFVSVPLRLRGGVGSPANAVAIF